MAKLFAPDPRIPTTKASLDEVVRGYQVQRLSLFGSAARGEMDDDSDIDLLVEFAEGHRTTLGELTRLTTQLAACFGGRKVDLATPAILRNPYRRRSIEKDMRVLSDAEAANRHE